MLLRDTDAGADMASVWEQKKLETRKMLKNGARREAAVPSVQYTLCWPAHSQLQHRVETDQDFP